ncbi:MAG TPA: hypothetical protein VIT91_00200 [Chthoniobacterales bacterium]
MPDVKTCCFTDEPELAQPWFDTVEVIDRPFRNFLEKIPPLSKSPFQRTIFVDTDTVFTGSMLDVFELLSSFEIAAAPDPFWCESPHLPACFMQLNTGLIAYQNTQRVRDFFHRWFADYERAFNEAGKPKRMHDQGVFQHLLFESDLRLYLLPVEYNLRLTCPQLVRIWAPAKMLHARHPDLLDLGRRVNSRSDVRVIWPNWRHFLRGDLFLIGRRPDRFLRAWAAMPKMALKLFLRS